MSERYQQFKSVVRDQTIRVSIIAVIVLFILVYLWQRVFITIMPGEAGVLWRLFFGGTKTDYVYAEGLHLIPPWDRMYIYNIKVQQTAHEFDVLTSDGLTLHLAISIRYFPDREMLGVLHQKVGTDYVNTVVIPEIESVLRVLIGQLRAEDVYATNKSIIEKAVNQAVEQIAQRFINVDNVIIKRIVFPAAITAAIENKMAEEQLMLAYKFKLEREKQEAERKRTEAGGLHDYYQILEAALSNRVLLWKGLQSTVDLAQSPNAKVVVIGSGERGLPIIGNIPMDAFPNFTAAAPSGTPNRKSSPPAQPTATPAQPAATPAQPTATPSAEEPAQPANLPELLDKPAESKPAPGTGQP